MKLKLTSATKETTSNRVSFIFDGPASVSQIKKLGKLVAVSIICEIGPKLEEWLGEYDLSFQRYLCLAGWLLVLGLTAL